MIENFTISANNRESLIAKIRALDESTLWLCTITERKSKRTNEQNRRLWRLYNQLSAHIGIDSDELHQLMGYKFLRYQKKVNGKTEEFIKSTTKLNTTEMVNYQDAIERWGAEAGFIFQEGWQE
jgi:hypothetical protein